MAVYKKYNPSGLAMVRDTALKKTRWVTHWLIPHNSRLATVLEGEQPIQEGDTILGIPVHVAGVDSACCAIQMHHNGEPFYITI